MTRNSDREQEVRRLMEDVIVLMGLMDDAVRSAMRYQRTNYDHHEDDLMDSVDKLHSYSGDILERYQGTGSDLS